MMKRLWAVLFTSVIAISLLLGFQFNAGMVLAAEAEPVSDGPSERYPLKMGNENMSKSIANKTTKEPFFTHDPAF